MGKNILIGFKNQLNIGCSFLNAIFKIYCFQAPFLVNNNFMTLSCKNNEKRRLETDLLHLLSLLHGDPTVNRDY